jgi:hypothetical protein
MPVPAVAVVAAVVVVALVLVVGMERRKARARTELLTTMGFRPLAQPDAPLAEALLAPFRRGRLAGRALALREVWTTEACGGRVCVFEVRDPASSRQSLVASGAVGLVRPGAGLPSFEICAYSEEGGPMDRMMVGFMSKGLGDGRIVRFGELPEFGKRFTVLAADDGDEAAVRGYLTAAVRQELLGSRFLVLKAGGDAFALQPNPVSPAARAGDAALLRELIEEAHRLARVLEPRRAAA